MARWPKDNQSDLIAFYGTPKTSVLESQLVDVVPPFRMTYSGTPVRAIKFHKKCAPALRAALDEIWNAYGRDQSKIDAARVSIYDGAYNPRMIRGSSTKWSNHAYAAAIDIDAAHNGFGAGKGTMPQIVIDAFKRQGARWGGDYKGRTDPMHFEFCGDGVVATHTDVPIAPSVDLTAKRRKMGEIMVDYEYGSPLKIEVVSDGTKEIAGVNQKYHPEMYQKLSVMVSKGDQAGARKAAAEYLVDYSNEASHWTRDLAIEWYLRQSYVNRGPTGSAKILQYAVGAGVDGIVGNETLGKMKGKTTDQLLSMLRQGSEKYERTLETIPGSGKKRDESWNKWQGMVNRWNKAVKDAQQFKGFTVDPVTGALIVAGAAATAGGAVVLGTQMAKTPEATTTTTQPAPAPQGTNWGTVIPIGAIVIGIAILVVVLLRKRKS